MFRFPAPPLTITREGFNTFSKLRPVFYQGPFSAIQMLFKPPYKNRALRMLNLLIKLKN